MACRLRNAANSFDEIHIFGAVKVAYFHDNWKVHWCHHRCSIVQELWGFNWAIAKVYRRYLLVARLISDQLGKMSSRWSTSWGCHCRSHDKHQEWNHQFWRGRCLVVCTIMILIAPMIHAEGSFQLGESLEVAFEDSVNLEVFVFFMTEVWISCVFLLSLRADVGGGRWLRLFSTCWLRISLCTDVVNGTTWGRGSGRSIQYGRNIIRNCFTDCFVGAKFFFALIPHIFRVSRLHLVVVHGKWRWVERIGIPRILGSIQEDCNFDWGDNFSCPEGQ